MARALEQHERRRSTAYMCEAWWLAHLLDALKTGSLQAPR
jgi:hypothetical protein